MEDYLTVPEKQNKRRLGTLGERLALCRYVDNGLRPVAVNWRAGKKAELDLIVFDERNDVLVICEVKTRTSGIDRTGSGSGETFLPSDSVGPRKRMIYIFAAKLFLNDHPEFAEKNVRFDVAEVYNINGAYEVSIIEEAF
ncbi:MAG: YraN family protein [Clostridia bacterium]|nr:YraN family protein [Clostridia bacterium]